VPIVVTPDPDEPPPTSGVTWTQTVCPAPGEPTADNARPKIVPAAGLLLVVTLPVVPEVAIKSPIAIVEVASTFT
jgi:hypothetical protein